MRPPAAGFSTSRVSRSVDDGAAMIVARSSHAQCDHRCISTNRDRTRVPAPAFDATVGGIATQRSMHARCDCSYASRGMRSRNGASSASASAAEPLQRLRVAARTRRVDQAGVERAQPRQQLLARVAAQRPSRRRARHPVPHDVVDRRRRATDPRRRAAPSAARSTRSRCAGSERAVAVRCRARRIRRAGRRRLPGRIARAERRRRGATRRTRRARRLRRTRCAPDDAAAPSRSSARSSDRCRDTRHVERHAARRPAADLLERRADDANQVAVVLAAEVRLDLPAVLGASSFALGVGRWESGVPESTALLPR